MARPINPTLEPTWASQRAEWWKRWYNVAHIIGNRDSFFYNEREYNKQGDYYLTTLETSRAPERGSDQQNGVIVSPLFIPKGGKMAFRVGGGPSTYCVVKAYFLGCVPLALPVLVDNSGLN